ncbi:hypothetical protein K461DRAFT_322500 [Myriangium duriaei CBS 260.36]|uniref:Nitrogen regulatory protein areA GATA-like domain-containing protein n=1 Tax=Myriangium duriaei CBS 260.36 TaxID=1168546 RepID=A0A9P4J0T2_9PEZI|nr:hypothetical protein K461DRAFT_322500 [Myriangium duriaei CBS 260.36]
MAEVLYPPRKPNGHSYYSTSSLKRSSSSYSSFLSQAGSQYTTSRSSPPTPPTTGHTFASSSAHSDAPTNSYQPFSAPSSLPPTPASSVSFEDKDDRENEDIAFPSYDDGVQFYHTDEPLDLPPSPSDGSDAGSTAREESNASQSTRSESPLPTPIVADDTAVKANPSRHVDYLSHDWREEDIWSSWRHIVSQRKVYGQRSRLENASWRTWAKSKYRLPTVSPETLNWLKESDVTWLYGPLQPATSHPITHRSPDPSPYRLSSQSSFINKKPILKKRSMSEVMLQRSLSANSLIKQAAAAVQAQQKGHPQTPTLQRGSSDFTSSTNQSRPISRDQLDYFSTLHSSGESTPSECNKRHIRFDDKVEQCIAVECKFPEQDEFDSDSDSDDSNSDSSDEGVLTMRKPRRRRPTMGAPSSRPQLPTKIIEKLPDTTLKYKAESPESSRTSINVPFLNSWYQSSKLNQSPSQETLRPSNPSRNFLIPADDDGDDVDPEMSWQPSGAFAGRQNGSAMGKMDDDDEVPSNMRRTPSGMFMPYDEDEDDESSELGLFGRVSETINTARDIAHVIWNVGWRK